MDTQVRRCREVLGFDARGERGLRTSPSQMRKREQRSGNAKGCIAHAVFLVAKRSHISRITVAINGIGQCGNRATAISGSWLGSDIITAFRSVLDFQIGDRNLKFDQRVICDRVTRNNQVFESGDGLKLANPNVSETWRF